VRKFLSHDDVEATWPRLISNVIPAAKELAGYGGNFVEAFSRLGYLGLRRPNFGPHPSVKKQPLKHTYPSRPHPENFWVAANP
jgi:hypothetical protein